MAFYQIRAPRNVQAACNHFADSAAPVAARRRQSHDLYSDRKNSACVRGGEGDEEGLQHTLSHGSGPRSDVLIRDNAREKAREVGRVGGRGGPRPTVVLVLSSCTNDAGLVAQRGLVIVVMSCSSA